MDDKELKRREKIEKTKFKKAKWMGVIMALTMLAVPTVAFASASQKTGTAPQNASEETQGGGGGRCP